MIKAILDSCGLDSKVSSARLMQWWGFLIVMGTWVIANVSGLIAAFVILIQKGAWTFTISDLVTIVSLVGAIIAGTTVQKFSKGDN
jgi:type II secretory pathway component PulF